MLLDTSKVLQQWIKDDLASIVNHTTYSYSITTECTDEQPVILKDQLLQDVLTMVSQLSINSYKLDKDLSLTDEIKLIKTTEDSIIIKSTSWYEDYDGEHTYEAVYIIVRHR